MNHSNDPYASSQVDASDRRSRSLFWGLALPLGGVFALTLLAGHLTAYATAAYPETASKYLPESWLTETRPPASRCRDGQCVPGLTPIGLPESCFVEPLDSVKSPQMRRDSDAE